MHETIPESWSVLRCPCFRNLEKDGVYFSLYLSRSLVDEEVGWLQPSQPSTSFWSRCKRRENPCRVFFSSSLFWLCLKPRWSLARRRGTEGPQREPGFGRAWVKAVSFLAVLRPRRKAGKGESKSAAPKLSAISSFMVPCRDLSQG